MPPLNQPQKSSRGLTISIIVIVLILLAGLIYSLYSKDKSISSEETNQLSASSSQTTPTNEGKVSSTSTITSSEDITQIDAELNAQNINSLDQTQY